MSRIGKCLPFFAFFAYIAFVPFPSGIFAQTADELQAKIDQRNQDIQALEKEIAGYQTQINALGSQADSLSSTIKSLDLTQKKLSADIQVTQNKIAAKNLEIQQLGVQITGKQNDISDDRRVIASAFKSMNESGNQSLPEIFLASDSISVAMNSIEDLATLQSSMYGRIDKLSNDKTRLETNKKASEKAKADLVKLNAQLSDQKKVVLSTAAEKNALLSQTKQSQSAYKQVLATKQAQEAALQQEILNYESQLKLAIDTTKLPHTGTGVLSWPLDGMYAGACPAPSAQYLSCITQYFGNTPFATANPQIYSGKGHTGVDFRASIGTPVKAALTGVVAGVGNTDLVPGCYSYGKWVMINHPDGLSTLYAHLSLPTVVTGQSVSTGEVIGYSGNTGYSTGPHLHFGVYATQGVVIKTFDTSINCKGALIPLADFKAYLNPLSYL